MQRQNHIVARMESPQILNQQPQLGPQNCQVTLSVMPVTLPPHLSVSLPHPLSTAALSSFFHWSQVTGPSTGSSLLLLQRQKQKPPFQPLLIHISTCHEEGAVPPPTPLGLSPHPCPALLGEPWGCHVRHSRSCPLPGLLSLCPQQSGRGQCCVLGQMQPWLSDGSRPVTGKHTEQQQTRLNLQTAQAFLDLTEPCCSILLSASHSTAMAQ